MNPSDARHNVASILIVDDTLPNLELLSEMLKARGYKVRPVPSGDLALQAAKGNPPDLILLDIHMPEMDGYEVCERLKADEKLQDIPVLFISGLSETSDKVKAFQVGGADYITKPFQFEEVEARVGTHLELRRQRRELLESYEQLQKLEKLRDDLTHMIVHDLRTPLTNILCSLELIQEVDYDRERTREFVPMAVEAGQTLVGMVNDMLDINKLEAGQMTLESTEFSVAEVIAAALVSVRRLADQKNLELSATVDPPDLRLQADEEKVRRALTNLLGNAVKFTRQGSVQVQARSADGSVVISVVDTGEGLPEADLERIFDKFGQVEARSAGHTMSTGLGLAFVKLSVEAHGGKVRVESELGKGSTFHLSLPALSPNAPTQ
ncbi:MAG: hybrid sensor histidine kinase/response regulator [Armatimonadota bacterium]